MLKIKLMNAKIIYMQNTVKMMNNRITKLLSILIKDILIIFQRTSIKIWNSILIMTSILWFMILNNNMNNLELILKMKRTSWKIKWLRLIFLRDKWKIKPENFVEKVKFKFNKMKHTWLMKPNSSNKTWKNFKFLMTNTNLKIKI